MGKRRQSILMAPLFLTKKLPTLILSDIIYETYYAKRKNFIGSGLGNIQKKFKVFLGIVILPAIVLLLFVFFIIFGAILLSSNSAFLNGLGLAALILSAVLALGGIIINLWSQTALLCAIKDREENIGIKESYRRGWGKIISYFWISFLSGIIITGGLFLFFIPGLIFFIWFSLASFVFISENKKGWSALAASKKYVRGNWLGVFWRFLCIAVISWLFFYLLTILASFVAVPAIEKIYFYVGYVLLTPMVTIYSFLIYENLKKIHSGDSVVQAFEAKK